MLVGVLKTVLLLTGSLVVVIEVDRLFIVILKSLVRCDLMQVLHLTIQRLLTAEVDKNSLALAVALNERD